MLFNSLLFLYYFLPLVLLGNILLQDRFRNKFLLVASLIFFAWGGVSYTFIFIGSILLNFAGGIFIDRTRSNAKRKKTVFVCIVSLNLLILGIFKYGGFVVENINWIYDNFGMNTLDVPRILLPIGISFYTFHGLSYITDVYRGTTLPQRKLSDLSLYMSFFPQLIAGPIVRYKDISKQLTERTFSYSNFNTGMYRFFIGLGKKVLVANTLAYLADTFFNSDPGNLGIFSAWLGIICYTFQIYFDFSAYSDMAIGLARCLGFTFKENFNFPYLAESIKDFWRRWHISLSSWFKDYVYIPLGGNRNGKFKTYRNLITVFFLTGLWHGASWNFIIWGFFHGFFIILESTVFGRVLNRLWKPFRVAYGFIVVLIGWVLFRADTLEIAIAYYKAMLGMNGKSESFFNEFITKLNMEQILCLVIAIAGSFGLLKRFNDFDQDPEKEMVLGKSSLLDPFKLIFSFCLLIICTVYLISGTYNPFIYFRF
ncbi:MAG TPA: MBOAT family O-acyltransferase [Bacteroidia bacterium]|nr:MBOAT family O-acyltransferase [Bacteroidia bacterium]